MARNFMLRAILFVLNTPPLQGRGERGCHKPTHRQQAHPTLFTQVLRCSQKREEQKWNINYAIK